MNGDFLPEFKVLPAKSGGYLASYRLFDGKPFKLIPGDARSTATQALNAAKDYVRLLLNPPIRAEQAPEPEPDALNVADWHADRIAREAERQEQALGGIISRGTIIKVERRRARA